MLHKKKDFWIVSVAFVTLGVFLGFIAGQAGDLTGSAVQSSSCFDSDGGENIRAYGYVLSYNDRTFDYCEDEYTIVEHSCSANKAEETRYRCAFGCDSGRCLDE